MSETVREIVATVHAHKALLAKLAEQRKVDAAIAIATQRIVAVYARPRP